MPETPSRHNAFANEPLLKVDNKIVRAYQAALDAYNTGNWDATVTSCGKAFESIAKTELPYNERSGTLGQLLEKLPKHIKPEQAMNDLSDAVKDSKGLGAHFDLERDTNDEIAAATLELLESAIVYFYLFKAKVHRLKQLIEAQPAPKSSKPTETLTNKKGDAYFESFDR